MSTLIDHAEEDEDLPQSPPIAKPSDHHAARPARSSFARKLPWFALALVAMAIVAMGLRGRGVGQWLKQSLGLAGEALRPPLVISARPADGAANVKPDQVLTFRMQAPNGLLDEATLNAGHVTLRRAGNDGATLPIAVSQELGDDKVLNITVRPAQALDGMTRYTLSIGTGLKDAKGVAAVARDINFSTGSLADPSIKFAKVPLPTVEKAGYTCVQLGPDGRLWAGTDKGMIYRFPIESDGTLGEPEAFASLQSAAGGNRLLVGFAFDPACGKEASAVADGKITLWVTHGWFGFLDAPDFSGKLSRISGKNLDTVHDVVTGLPRSIKDHLTNQPSFGPDGALYIPQASNTSYGAPDGIWGNRSEHKLNATILRLDVAALAPGQSIDAKTTDVGGSYNPDAPGAPLTIYVTGVRLAYDLLFHSNGKFYTAVNGSSPGGNTPAGDGAPALPDVKMTEPDWFFTIEPGRYYGHPNPAQGHYVLNGGNPTAGLDPGEVKEYPVGTKPDPRWAPATYDFGTHVSANGLIEYRANTFDGKMKGKVLVCRYNNGSDILCLDLDEQGNVRAAHVGIPGLTRLSNPLDVTEDAATGNLYVSEYGAETITLLRPAK